MRRTAWFLLLVSAMAVSGCAAKGSQTPIGGFELDLSQPAFQPTPRPYSEVVVYGNGKISEPEYAAIQEAVSRHRQTVIPSATTTAPEDGCYSPAIFQIRVEGPEHVTADTSFYGVFLCAGNIIDLTKVEGRWVVRSVGMWVK